VSTKDKGNATTIKDWYTIPSVINIFKTQKLIRVNPIRDNVKHLQKFIRKHLFAKVYSAYTVQQIVIIEHRVLRSSHRHHKNQPHNYTNTLRYKANRELRPSELEIIDQHLSQHVYVCSSVTNVGT